MILNVLPFINNKYYVRIKKFHLFELFISVGLNMPHSKTYNSFKGKYNEELQALCSNQLKEPTIEIPCGRQEATCA